MQPITPARRASRRLPASTCAEIEMAVPRIDDEEIVAWLQRHHAAATTRGPILRPYDRDAIAWFRVGLLHAPEGQPALVLSDGRAFEATDGVLGRDLGPIDFRALQRMHGFGSRWGELGFWVGVAAIAALIVARIFIIG